MEENKLKSKWLNTFTKMVSEDDIDKWWKLLPYNVKLQIRENTILVMNDYGGGK